MAQKILLVDDDAAFRELLSDYLAASGFSVVEADNGAEAVVLSRESKPDIMLVDADMPGLDGHSVCRAVKKDAATRGIPVVIMSGRRIEEDDVVAGLEGGADDYLLKPFPLAVMRARLQTVLRRYHAPRQTSGALKKAGLELDPAGRTVKVEGKSVSLARKEFDLLLTLVGKAGSVLSANYLLETVWGYDPAEYNDPDTVVVHMSHLRRKLGPRIARHIVNMKGVGYKFEE